MRRADLTGLRFGRLEVVERYTDYVSPSGKRYARWLCKCDCGKASIPQQSSLRVGRSSSCGCLASELSVTRATKHGGYKSRLYVIWDGMKDRCQNQNNKAYQFYGGRGIAVCQQWLDFETFRNWALSNGYTDKLSIDRWPDRSGGYEPRNCRWATAKQQSRNIKTNRPIVRSDGKRYGSIAEAAEDVRRSTSSVFNAASGRSKSCAGFQFNFETKDANHG